MRHRLLTVTWLVILGMTAIIPLSAVFHGIIHLGSGPLYVSRALNKPLISIGSDVTLKRGTTAVVVVVLGNIRLSGVAKDDLVAVDGHIYLEPRSRAERDVLTILGATHRAHGARVDGRLGGAVRAWNDPRKTASRDLGKTMANSIRLGLAAGLALLLIGTCLTIVFPWQVVLISTTLRDAPVKSAVAGVMILLTFVFLVVPLVLSLPGLPFALLLAASAFLAWLFGLTAAAVVLGRLVSRQPASLLWATAAGLVVLALAMAIPFIGALVVTLVGLTGAGALAVALLSRSRPLAPIA
jgi:hypothetical protein